MNRLSYDQIVSLFTGYDSDSMITFDRVRPHNRSEIRRPFTLAVRDLLNEIRTSLDEGYIYGGDMEVPLNSLQLKLIGHHDGIFWTEPIQSEQVVPPNGP
jgi:hypothetical protein